jgi:hypothetical protein
MSNQTVHSGLTQILSSNTENLPLGKQYLLTTLSTFFALGAVLSSVIGLMVLPAASCETATGCDIPSGENDGWKNMLFILALLVRELQPQAYWRLIDSPGSSLFAGLLDVHYPLRYI